MFAQSGGIPTELRYGSGQVTVPILVLLGCHLPTAAVVISLVAERSARLPEPRRASGDTSGIWTHATSTDVHTP